MVHLLTGRQVRCTGNDIDRYGRPVVTCTADGDTLT